MKARESTPTHGGHRRVTIRGFAHQRRGRAEGTVCLGKEGYTLVELIMVMVVVGIVFAVTAPNLRHAILSDPLKTAARRLVGLMRELRNASVSERQAYVLCLDVSRNRFWVVRASMTEDEKALAREKAHEVPPEVRIRDVWIKGRGKIAEGEARIGFAPRGYAQASAVHLRAGDGREVTLEVTPFLSQVVVFDTYVEYQ